MEDLTDDEAIATAMLLGCTFWCAPNYPGDYYIHGDVGALHPLEKNRGRTCIAAGWPWHSKADVARDYIKFTLESNDGA